MGQNSVKSLMVLFYYSQPRIWVWADGRLCYGYESEGMDFSSKAT